MHIDHSLKLSQPVFEVVLSSGLIFYLFFDFLFTN